MPKHPRLAEWKELQDKKPAEDAVRRWWARWPTANVGIVTGMVSRLCVVDVDVRNDGLETLADLDAAWAVMPDDGPVVQTGALGLHHYFTLDMALPKVAPFVGIEVQADGALVVAPPSIHASGRSYRWLRDLTYRRSPLPTWVRWACQRVTTVHTPSVPLVDAGEDDVLGALVGHGLYITRHRRKGLHRIRCPWAAEHSNAEPEAVVIEPGVSQAPGWGFRCLHSHCSARHIGDLLDVLAVPRRRSA